MKSTLIHKKVEKDLLDLSQELRLEIAQTLDLIANGLNIGLPRSRPMPSISIGSHELRVKDSSGQYRVFYYTKVKDSILVFHFFQKKTQKTPLKEIETAKKRLAQMKY